MLVRYAIPDRSLQYELRVVDAVDVQVEGGLIEWQQSTCHNCHVISPLTLSHRLPTDLF
jgi:hypothetical protein